MAEMNVVQSWLQTVSLLGGMIAAIVAAFRYRLKAKESQMESDVKLAQLFTQLMSVAHARGESHLSEECVKSLFAQNLFSQKDPGDDSIRRKIESSCVITLPVGIASQDAAIASIGELGRRYDVLREPAREGLKALATFKPEQAQKALDRIESR